MTQFLYVAIFVVLKEKYIFKRKRNITVAKNSKGHDFKGRCQILFLFR